MINNSIPYFKHNFSNSKVDGFYCDFKFEKSEIKLFEAFKELYYSNFNDKEFFSHIYEFINNQKNITPQNINKFEYNMKESILDEFGLIFNKELGLDYVFLKEFAKIYHDYDENFNSKTLLQVLTPESFIEYYLKYYYEERNEEFIYKEFSDFNFKDYFVEKVLKNNIIKHEEIDYYFFNIDINVTDLFNNESGRNNIIFNYFDYFEKLRKENNKEELQKSVDLLDNINRFVRKIPHIVLLDTNSLKIEKVYNKYCMKYDEKNNVLVEVPVFKAIPKYDTARRIISSHNIYPFRLD